MRYYVALKLHPDPRVLLNVYEKTASRQVLDTRAQLIAHDLHLTIVSKGTRSSWQQDWAGETKSEERLEARTKQAVR